MLYCLNLNCDRPENQDDAKICQNCGTTLLLRNRFRVLKPLGEGGLGKTYLAEDCDKMDESCVVKQLKYDSQGTQANKKIVELFMREAQQLYEMRGQAQIPDLMAYFEDGGYFYLVQELVDGEDLEHEKARGLFDEAKIRALLGDVLPILRFVHQRRVIHRDMKPANIMRRKKDGKLVLIDFGVSRQLSKGLTTVGGITIVGTPGYAPFEQMTEGNVDPGPGSDLYSLGVTCFELMSGIPPYPLSLQEGYRWVENWRQHVKQPVSQELQGVLDGLLKMKTSERFQTADQVLGALNAQASLQEYQGYLTKYEAEYRKMSESQWPLSSYLTEQLERLRSQWGLVPDDVTRVENPIRDRAEAEYQARLAKKAQERQQAQAEIEAERQRVEALQRETSERQRQEALRREEETRRRQEQETLVQQRRAEAQRQADKTIQPTTPQNLVQPQVNQPLVKSRRDFLKWAAFGGVGLGGVLIYQVVQSPGESEPGTSAQNQPGESVKSQQTISANAFQEDLGNGVTLDMVKIPGGTFTMGSPSSEAGRDDDEGPQREVTVPGFAMGQFEVTQAQYEVVMGDNPANFKGANRPVEQVSWNEAVEFCQKLSQQVGKDYRLPSEAEWEYACRAGTTTPYSFGESLAKTQANYDSESTIDVGSFPANDFGLYDMHGNVWEWCLDHWHDNYQGAPTDGSAWTTGGDSDRRILRGGSCYNDSAYCRSASRDWFNPVSRVVPFGFRVVVSVPRIS